MGYFRTRLAQPETFVVQAQSPKLSPGTSHFSTPLQERGKKSIDGGNGRNAEEETMSRQLAPPVRGFPPPFPPIDHEKVAFLSPFLAFSRVQIQTPFEVYFYIPNLCFILIMK